MEDSFQSKLLKELHGLRESFVRLETRFENFLEVREEVDTLKKKIQDMEVEQAVQKGRSRVRGPLECPVAIVIRRHAFAARPPAEVFAHGIYPS